MRIPLIFAIVSFIPLSAQAESYELSNRPECMPTPQERCKMRGGKWQGDMCVITKRILRKRVVRKPQEKISDELRCYRQGGEWRDEMCYARQVPAPKAEDKAVGTESKSSPASSSVVNVSQQVAVKQEFKEAGALKKQRVKKAAANKQSRKWLLLGPGAFVSGFYMTGERGVLTGVQGKLVFAVNDRFRLGGMLGYALWQEYDLLLGGTFDTRVWRSLFVTLSFDTFWGGFDRFSVRRRYLLPGVGATYFFNDRADISLRFIFGTRKETVDCEGLPDNFVGGNMFTINVYF